MCGKTNQAGCSCYNCTPALWSKEKKLEVLTKQLGQLKEQQGDIEKAIEEIKGN